MTGDLLSLVDGPRFCPSRVWMYPSASAVHMQRLSAYIRLSSDSQWRSLLDTVALQQHMQDLDPVPSTWSLNRLRDPNSIIQVLNIGPIDWPQNFVHLICYPCCVHLTQFASQIVRNDLRSQPRVFWGFGPYGSIGPQGLVTVVGAIQSAMTYDNNLRHPIDVYMQRRGCCCKAGGGTK